MSEPPAPHDVRVVEVRILEGPNLYFPRPAVKVTLQLPGPLALTPGQAIALGQAVGLKRTHPGAPGSVARQRLLLGVVERVVRALAKASGTTRLGVRSRPGSATDEVVVAFVWRHRGRAEALGDAVGPTLADIAGGMPLADAVAARAEAIGAAPSGPRARIVTPRIPVVSVTGTNGKTTTTRMLAHIGMVSGRHTAWSSTDGVLDHGSLVEKGDYSGPAGARTVLTRPGVQLGIVETARGGMLLKGLGITHNDVSVVTNVSADHLGSHGIDTVDQLAEVKAIITRATRPRGWVVLNGDDPRVWAMHAGLKPKPWVFSLDPTTPAIREALNLGGRATTVLDDWICVLDGDAVDRLARVVDVPVTLAGLSRHNVANALAATSAALAIGIERPAVIEGLRTFAPDANLNPGRMNVYSLPVEAGTATVVLDLAHNEAGLEALLDVAHGLTAPGGRVHLALGTAGDRTDEILQALGEIAGRRADHVVAAHKERYLRGRSVEDLEHQLLVGLNRAGVATVESYPTELAGMRALVAGASDGDVVAVMCHSERADIADWLARHSGTADDATAIRRKVVIARGEHEAEAEIDALWELTDDQERIAQGLRLQASYPGDARVLYELAGTYDSAGDENSAIPLYEGALAGSLPEPYRHRAEIQLASSLRAVGRFADGLEHIESARARYPESVGIAAFAALIDHDAGHADRALGRLVAMIAGVSTDADVERYRRSLTAYGAALADRPVT
ncbi:MAG: tetratricopeptide repeat protein [Phycicoccus sp.]|nr:tetratricopeptide repeat protein [Phycicoccus sp.]